MPGKRNKNTVIFSLGGSLVYPDQIDILFLKKFKTLIEEFVDNGHRAVIVVGGGSIARRYNTAARKLNPKVTDRELDWMGIKATKVNAELVRIMFNSRAYYKVLDSPQEIVEKSAQIYVSGGWKPGASSDHVAVHLAVKFKAGEVINLTNIDFVYNKDPRKFKDAKKLRELTWSEFRELVGDTWDPGANLPFDPIASRVADEKGVRVAILNGNKLTNLKKYLQKEKFNGTIIS